MNDIEDDEKESLETGALPVSSVPVIKNKAYSSVLRNLKEEELLNIGCLRLLVEDKERLESEKTELIPFQSKFYEKKLENAVLGEKVKQLRLNEILYNITISIGGLFLGLSNLFGIIGILAK